MEKSKEHSAQLESFENRRNYPRLKMQLPVVVSLPDSKKLKAYICNISPGGAQIQYAASKGKDLIQPLTTEATEKSRKCTLKFDLSYANGVASVKIGAHPVYSHPHEDDQYLCGMLFSEKKISENKKISDFLFHQLQVSFAELEHTREDQPAAVDKTVATIQQTIIEKAREDNPTNVGGRLGKDLDALIVQLTQPNTHLEAMKQILINILSSLKANQELTRHIDERIYHIIQKLSRIN